MLVVYKTDSLQKTEDVLILNPSKVLSPGPFFFAHICTKLFSGWDFAPDLTGGAHSAPQNPLAGKGERRGTGGEGRNRKGREGKRGEVASS